MKKNVHESVQGGIEPTDTNVLDAGLREIEEEIGLRPPDVIYVQELQPPSGNPMEFSYRVPPYVKFKDGDYVGQVQRILLFFCHSSTIAKVVLVPPPELGVRQEFRDVQWMTIEALTEATTPGKQKIYGTVGRIAPPIIRAYLESRHFLKEAELPSKY